MTNKEKRSIILSCVIGDGNISEINVYNGVNSSGSINIKHGIKQGDYLKWKAEILSKIKDKEINILDKVSYVKALDKSYDQKAIQWVSKKFRAWKRIFYHNKVKDIPKILKFIRHPYFATAVWMMDDGSCTRTTKKNGTVVFTGFVLYTCDQSEKSNEEMIDWFKIQFPGIMPKIKWTKMKYKGTIRQYPYIRFSNKDSLTIWKMIEPFVSQIPSMKEKFKVMYTYADKCYYNSLQHSEMNEDIVHKS